MFLYLSLSPSFPSHNYNKKTRQKLKKFSTPGCGYRYESSSSKSGTCLLIRINAFFQTSFGNLFLSIIKL